MVTAAAVRMAAVRAAAARVQALAQARVAAQAVHGEGSSDDGGAEQRTGSVSVERSSAGATFGFLTRRCAFGGIGTLVTTIGALLVEFAKFSSLEGGTKEHFMYL